MICILDIWNCFVFGLFVFGIKIRNSCPQTLTTLSGARAKAGTIVWPFSVLKSVLFNDGLPGQI